MATQRSLWPQLSRLPCLLGLQIANAHGTNVDSTRVVIRIVRARTDGCTPCNAFHAQNPSTGHTCKQQWSATRGGAGSVAVVMQELHQRHARTRNTQHVTLTRYTPTREGELCNLAIVTARIAVANAVLLAAIRGRFGSLAAGQVRAPAFVASCYSSGTHVTGLRVHREQHAQTPEVSLRTSILFRGAAPSTTLRACRCTRCKRMRSYCRDTWHSRALGVAVAYLGTFHCLHY